VTWLHWQGLPKLQGLHISIPLGRDLSVMCGGINPVIFDVCVYGHAPKSVLDSKCFQLESFQFVR